MGLPWIVCHPTNPEQTPRPGFLFRLGDTCGWICVSEMVLPVCFWCGTVSSEGSLRRCGACRGAQYCNAECQKLDWAAHHRAVCKDPDTRPLLAEVFEASDGRCGVWQTATMGRGVVAMTQFAPGDKVFDDPEALVHYCEDDLLGARNLFKLKPLARHLVSRLPKGWTSGPGLGTLNTQSFVQHVNNRMLPTLPPAFADIRAGHALSEDHLDALTTLSEIWGEGGPARDEAIGWFDLLFRGSSYGYPVTYDSLRLEVDTQVGVLSANSFDAGDYLGILSVPGSLFNHSCKRSAVICRMHPGTLAPHPDDPYLHTARFCGWAVQAIPRHSEVFTTYGFHERGLHKHKLDRWGVAVCDAGNGNTVPDVAAAREMLVMLGPEPAAARDDVAALVQRMRLAVPSRMVLHKAFMGLMSGGGFNLSAL